MAVFQSIDVGYGLLGDGRVELTFKANREVGPAAVFRVQISRAMLKALCWDLVGILEGIVPAGKK